MTFYRFREDTMATQESGREGTLKRHHDNLMESKDQKFETLGKKAKLDDVYQMISSHMDEKNSLSSIKKLLSTHASIAFLTDEGQRCAIKAIKEDRHQIFRLFLKHSPKLANTVFNPKVVEFHKGLSPVMCCVRHGSIGCFKVLRDFDADVNLQSKGGWSALMYAAIDGKIEWVKALLESGADINMQTKDGSTALMNASVVGVVECVRKLLENGADVNIQDNDGRSALMFAARDGATRCLNVLIEAGADVNMQNKEGWSALIYAASMGEIECMNILIKNGADIQMRTNQGMTAVYFVANLHDIKCLEALEEDGVIVQASEIVPGFMTAAKYGDVEYVEALVRRYIDVNIQHSDGWTALMYTARHGRLECLKVLVENGSDVNIQNDTKMTALAYAALYGNTECLKVLLKQHPDINVQNIYAGTALMNAACYGEVECLRELIKAKANLNALYEDGQTALMKAVKYNQDDCVNELVEAGADVNVVDKSGMTALTMAVRLNNPKIISLLLDNDADVNKCDDKTWESVFEQSRAFPKTPTMLPIEYSKQGYSELIIKLKELGEDLNVSDENEKTALMHACWFDKCETVRALVKSGLNVNAKDNDGCTALMFACMVGCEDCSEALIQAGADVKATDKYGRTALFLCKLAPLFETKMLSLYQLLLTHGGSFNLCTLDTEMKERFLKSITCFDQMTQSIIYELLLRFECTKCCQEIMFRIRQNESESSILKHCERINSQIDALQLEKTAARVVRSQISNIQDLNFLPLSREEKMFISCLGCFWYIGAAEAMFPEVMDSTEGDDCEDAEVKPTVSLNENSKSNDIKECQACVLKDMDKVCILRYEDKMRLLKIEGVHRIGLKPKATRYTVYLKDTKAESEIQQQIPEHQFHYELTEGKPISLNLGTAYGIGPTPTCGTLGGILHIDQNTAFALTCKHVVENNIDGDEMCVFPSGGNYEVLGELKGNLMGNIGIENSEQITFDIALIKMLHSSKLAYTTLLRDGFNTCDDWISQSELIQDKSIVEVEKTGRASKHTRGRITDKDFTGMINYKNKQGKPVSTMLVSAIEIESVDPNKKFAMAGDSGSLVVRQENGRLTAIGMFYFYDEDKAYAFPLKDSLEALKLKYPDQALFRNKMTLYVQGVPKV